LAKSPLSKGSERVKLTQNRKNIIPLNLTIPYMLTSFKNTEEFDISHLAHIDCDKNNDVVVSRTPYLRSYCRKAQEYVANGKSSKTVTGTYDIFRAYLRFCDSVNVNPFTEEGYLKYAGNDGELRHRVKVYTPSKFLWERSHDDELGIKESTAGRIISTLSTALSWCGLPSERWRLLHRPFNSIKASYEAYTDDDEKMIVSRLSDLFFGLASQLIAVKKDNLTMPDELPVSIDFGKSKETLMVTTSLTPRTGSINYACAFNLTMGAAYHLICYFTSLNDSVVRTIAHPIIVHTDARDKSLQTIKVSGFKARANKEVDAILTNESSISFDVEKKSGVLFINTLAELSKLYGNTKELLFSLDKNEKESNVFNIRMINRHITSTVNLVSEQRAACLPWFKELFYSYLNGEYIELRNTTNKLGRISVRKHRKPITSKSLITSGLFNSSYCILSCYTDSMLKGILLPLSYSTIDKNGNITVSFQYQNGSSGEFIIPAGDKVIIEDIEGWATQRARRQLKHLPRLLLKIGNDYNAEQWEGINPISSNLMSRWAIKPDEYFISLSSSRFRETTSSQEYKVGRMSHLVNLLQNTLETLNKHYANGNPRENKIILSQGIQVLERIAQSGSLEEAKEHVTSKLAIPILTYNEWLKNKEKTNPNGIACNGEQDIQNGKGTQRETNKLMGLQLPCAEFDMCHMCNSAKAVDEPQAIYKLISFIDVLRESLDQHPYAKQHVLDKIEAFEYTLDGASADVYKEASELFKKNGRHPRVSLDHATVSIYR